MATAQDSRADRALSLLLRPFAKVEPSESVTVSVLTLTVFLLLSAYYLLKTAREPLILLHGGAEVKSYAAAGQALLLLGFVQAYGWVAKKVGRMRLLLGVYLFFVANLILFAVLTRAGVAVAVPFYLWVGVYNYTSIAQFWGYASDVYTPAQGKRLFAVIGIGSSVGAVAGARLAKSLVPLGPEALMLGAGILLGVCCALLGWVNARLEAPAPAAAKEADSKPLSHESAFALLAHDKFLLLVAGLTLFTNWCNSNGEYILDRTLLAAVPAGSSAKAAAIFLGQFKADYFEWVNLLGVVLQLFAVSRILDKLGVRAALFFLPIVAFGGYTVMLVSPVLSLIRLAKVAENSLDYSVQNTARQALYLVATRVEKYVGKTAVDSFFVRLGDVLSASVVWLGAKLALSTPAFAAVNLCLILVWLVFVVLVGREHRQRSEQLERGGFRLYRTEARRDMKWRVFGAACCASFALAMAADAAVPKRKLPDYGNRGKDPTSVGDVVIWVPRVILSPVYLVTEYGIRWPLGHLIAAAERANVPDILYNFFFFGPNHSAGFAPIAFVDFGFRPSVGLYTFWDDAGFKGHDLRFHGSTGGSQWFAGVFTDRIRFHRDDSLSLTLTGLTRPDRTFFGLGPDTLQSNISRYGEKRFEADAEVDFNLWRASSVHTSVGIRSLDFRHGYYEDDPSIETEVAAGTYPLPDGFRGYTAQTSGVRLAFDNRVPSPADGSGVRVEVEAEEGTDVRREVGAAWLRYSATAVGFLDLNGRNRVLSLSLTTSFADSLNKRPVPFSELVQLGGAGPMRGFYPGRLRDNSAAVLTAKYRWPIWVWLDGSLQAAVGNVFGDHLRQLELSRSRLSAAIGLESVGSRDGSFELLVGFGSETFDHGGQVDSARILVGTNRGF